MPAEWEPHEATWLGWPHNPTDWPDKLDTIRWVYGEMVRKISRANSCGSSSAHQPRRSWRDATSPAPGCDLTKVRFVIHPTNRGWTRDSGPMFVRRKTGRRTETAIVHFHFNAWAKYDDWQKDRKVPETAARLLKKRLFNAECNGTDFVLEGGGIDVNGRGTLLTTEECYLDPKVQVRNPGLGRKEIDGTLRKYLGVTNVLWLRQRAGRRRHPRAHRRHLPVREPQDGGADPGDEPQGRQLPAAGGELGTDPGSAAGGRLQAGGGAAADAGAAALRRLAPAGQLRQFLHLPTRPCSCRRSTIPTTASRSASSANCSGTGPSSAFTRSIWSSGSARCIA